ncbi:MAG: methyltransferase domain-containing protein [Nitrospirae bacterium]|nr:methyltransferase domain-containing protein [Nitrospirota bacterium]
MDNTYLSLKYNSKSRWLSYWYQISKALEVSPASVLLVGKGSGITDNVIKQLSGGAVKIVTLDINYAVQPDVGGDVLQFPFKDGSFDAAICCQVLEHVPFNKFGAALGELSRVAKKRVVISLPHKRKHLKLSFHLPFIGEKTLIVKHPLTLKYCTSKNHCWEITRGVSRKQVVHEINKFFDIEQEFLNELNCNHRFFILKGKKV